MKLVRYCQLYVTILSTLQISLAISWVILLWSLDQQQRSSSNNISLSPFRSNNNLEKLLVLLVSKVFCTNKLFLKASNWLSCKVYSVELGYYHTRTYTCSPSSWFIQWHNRKQFKIKRQSIFILGVILVQVLPEMMLHIYRKMEYSV